MPEFLTFGFAALVFGLGVLAIIVGFTVSALTTTEKGVRGPLGFISGLLIFFLGYGGAFAGVCLFIATLLKEVLERV